MNPQQLNRLKNKSNNSVKYLKEIEKGLFKGSYVKSFRDKRTFINFIRENHTDEEIQLLINDLEINYNRHLDFIKILFPSVTAFIAIFLSFMSGMSIFLFNADLNLALKSIEQETEYTLFKYITELLAIFIKPWLASLMVITLLITIAINNLPNRKLFYLTLLKSI